MLDKGETCRWGLALLESAPNCIGFPNMSVTEALHAVAVQKGRREFVPGRGAYVVAGEERMDPCLYRGTSCYRAAGSSAIQVTSENNETANRAQQSHHLSFHAVSQGFASNAFNSF